MIVPKIYSTLGSDTSLVPLLLKDAANTTGMTTGAYITGSKIESKDRLIDEVGTAAIWLLGMPVFKKLLDWTAFKAANIDSAFDIRNFHTFKNKEILQSARENLPKNIEGLKEGFERVLEKKDFVKTLNVSKFITAAILTLGAYSMLTNFRHKHTRECIKKHKAQRNKAKFINTKSSLEEFLNKKPGKGVNFTGIGSIMANPVQNTMVVDIGITGTRLGKSQTPQEFIGYTIKEGGGWAFMYLIQKPLREYFEKVSQAGGKCIALDSKVIEGATLKNFLTKPDLNAIPDDDAKLYKFLVESKTKDHAFVKMAKDSGLLKTFKDTDIVDTRRYIDLDAVRNMKKSLGELAGQYAQETDKSAFLESIKKAKRTAVLKNIGVSALALGIAIPGVMIAMRYLLPNNKEFRVKDA